MSWANPFPKRFGGGATKLVDDLYATARGGSGSLLGGDTGTEIDIENRVIARMMSIGWRAAQGRALQSDSRKLSDIPRRVTFPDGTVEEISPLARQERILGLRPPLDADVTARRMAVHRKRVLSGHCDRGTLYALLAIACDGWSFAWAKKTTPDVGTMDAFWPDANYTPARPGEPLPEWASIIGRVSIVVNAPPTATQAQRDARMSAITELLDAILPAAAAFGVSIP